MDGDSSQPGVLSFLPSVKSYLLFQAFPASLLSSEIHTLQCSTELLVRYFLFAGLVSSSKQELLQDKG